ncbi:hypothetical protein BKA66DRAFT_388617, partial [Pyrenochaeta sp. MPI-SDFR-AT-0127]
MCIETQRRFRRCGHTQLHCWRYCSVIIPSDRLPQTGRACRRYKLRYKHSQNSAKCFE